MHVVISLVPLLIKKSNCLMRSSQIVNAWVLASSQGPPPSILGTRRIFFSRPTVFLPIAASFKKTPGPAAYMLIHASPSASPHTRFFHVKQTAAHPPRAPGRQTERWAPKPSSLTLSTHHAPCSFCWTSSSARYKGTSKTC